MNRRGFLHFLGIAPAAVPMAVAAMPGTLVLSDSRFMRGFQRHVPDTFGYSGKWSGGLAPGEYIACTTPMSGIEIYGVNTSRGLLDLNPPRGVLPGDRYALATARLSDDRWENPRALPSRDPEHREALA